LWRRLALEAVQLGVDGCDLVVERQAYGEFHDRHKEDANPTSYAMAGLLARVARVGWEVRTLLAAGLPGGALARARTLHEASVIATVLGRHPDTDVVQCYLDHADVDKFQRMRGFQEHAEALGLPPHTDGNLAGFPWALRLGSWRCRR
jgi:hypothetical protein